MGSVRSAIPVCEEVVRAELIRVRTVASDHGWGRRDAEGNLEKARLEDALWAEQGNAFPFKDEAFGQNLPGQNLAV
jgi:hypothetical protein